MGGGANISYQLIWHTTQSIWLVIPDNVLNNVRNIPRALISKYPRLFVIWEASVMVRSMPVNQPVTDPNIYNGSKRCLMNDYKGTNQNYKTPSKNQTHWQNLVGLGLCFMVYQPLWGLSEKSIHDITNFDYPSNSRRCTSKKNLRQQYYSSTSPRHLTQYTEGRWSKYFSPTASSKKPSQP